MSSFEYRRDDNRVMLHSTNSDVKRLAAEVGYITHEIYSSLMRQNPIFGKAFQRCLMLGMTPGSPIWEVSELEPGGVEIVLLTPDKEDDHEA